MSRPRHHPASGRGAWWLAVLVCLVACTTPPGDDDPNPSPSDAAADPGAVADPPEEDPAACVAAHDQVLRWVHADPIADLTASAVDDRRLASWLRHGLHQGLYARTATGELVPDLLVDEPRVEPAPDGTVIVHHELRDGLRFSDGTPLTGQTVQDTYTLLADPDAARALGDVPGYDRILPDGWTVDGPRFSYTLDGPFAGRRQLFSRVLPTHVLPDVATAEAALRTLTIDGDPLPVSGPYVPTTWRPGVELVLERDPDHHGTNPARRDRDVHGPACLGTLVLRLVDGPDAVAQALRDGEADLAVQTVTPATASLPAGPFPRRVPVDGPVTQLVVQPTGPHLGDLQVREALAALVDRHRIVEEAHLPLLGDEPPAAVAGTVLLPPDPTRRDLPHDAGLGRGDLDAATRHLEAAGYAPDPSGIWAHPERGRLTLRLETVAEDPVRGEEGRLLATALAAHGWDVRHDERPLEVVLERWVPAATPDAAGDGDVDDVGEEVAGVAVLALDVAPDPWAQAERYRSGAGPLGAAALDPLLDRCASHTDPSRCYLLVERALVTAEGDPAALTAVPLARRPYVVLHAAARVGRVPAVSAAADAGLLTVAAELLPAD